MLKLLAIWTPIALYAIYSIYQLSPGEPIVIENLPDTPPESRWPLIHRTLHPFYPWVILAPYVLYLCSRFPLGIRRARVAIPVILAAATGFVLASWHIGLTLERSLTPLVYIETRDPELSGLDINAIVSGAIRDLNKPEADGAATVFRQSVDGELVPLEDMPAALTEMLKKQGVDLDNLTPGSTAIAEASPIIIAQTLDNLAPTTDLPPSSRAGGVTSGGRPLSFASLHIAGFLLLGGIAHASTYYRGYKERETRNAKLSAEVSEARLAHLQSQLSPHFLFNALNGISSHVHDQPDSAVDMIAHLSDLLRLALSQPEGTLIPLRDELAITDHYLKLQAMRFGDRLKVQRDIDESALATPVPPFFLQPLVENAIHHAIEPRTAGGTITLSARLEDDRLHLSVQDDGNGEARDREGTGVGLQNITTRLATLYPNDHTFLLTPDKPTGTKIQITLPKAP